MYMCKTIKQAKTLEFGLCTEYGFTSRFSFYVSQLFTSPALVGAFAGKAHQATHIIDFYLYDSFKASTMEAPIEIVSTR